MKIHKRLAKKYTLNVRKKYLTFRGVFFIAIILTLYYNTVKLNKEIKNEKKMYKELKKLTKELKHFPTMKEWNKYAVENNLYCAITLEYILNIKWCKLREKINKDIKDQ